MPYTLSWYDDQKSIIVISAELPVTWDEYQAINRRAVEAARSVSHRIDLVLNGTHYGLPAGNPLPHYRRAFALWRDVANLHMTAVIVARQMRILTGELASIAWKLLGMKMPGKPFFADSFAEALKKIEADRAQNSMPVLPR